jgi:phosphocarrier protein
MQQRTIIVQNRLGLHARVAAKIVRLSSQFESHLRLQRLDDDRSGDAKSIFDILLLAASQGTELILVASGKDEEEALSPMHTVWVGSRAPAPEAALWPWNVPVEAGKKLPGYWGSIVILFRKKFG